MSRFNYRLTIVRLGGMALISALMGDVSAQEQGKLAVTSHQDGTKLKAGMPVTFSGTHSLPRNQSHIFCFLRDPYGFYLQGESIEFVNDQAWEYRGIRPGKGIDTVVFCQVDSAGAERLKAWQAQGSFEKINRGEVEKVPGYRELTRTKVIVE